LSVPVPVPVCGCGWQGVASTVALATLLAHALEGVLAEGVPAPAAAHALLRVEAVAAEAVHAAALRVACDLDWFPSRREWLASVAARLQVRRARTHGRSRRISIHLRK
jgi:hypothetical protein